MSDDRDFKDELSPFEITDSNILSQDVIEFVLWSQLQGDWLYIEIDIWHEIEGSKCYDTQQLFNYWNENVKNKQ